MGKKGEAGRWMRRALWFPAERCTSIPATGSGAECRGMFCSRFPWMENSSLRTRSYAVLSSVQAHGRFAAELQKDYRRRVVAFDGYFHHSGRDRSADQIA